VLVRRICEKTPAFFTIILKSCNHLQCWAEYSTFTVGDESSNYTLHVAGYSGTAGDAMVNITNGCTTCNLDGMKFTTRDRDNDAWSTGQCANQPNNVGGFWFRACTDANVNNIDSSNFGFSWRALPTGGSSSKDTRGLLVSRLSLVEL
jgi:hypothetical protein